MADCPLIKHFPTLFDFDNYDGYASLKAIIDASVYRTLAQVVASLTLFSHPDTVRQTAGRPVIRIIRNAPQRGKIIEIEGQRVGLDDNKAPTDVFMWCNQLKHRPKDVQFNHVYLNSQDPEIYTSLANLCVTPSFLAKMTDTHLEISSLLCYRVWKLYDWHPADRNAPCEPEGYADLVWAPCLPPVPDVRAAFATVAEKRVKDRTSIFANELGAFPGGECASVSMPVPAAPSRPAI